METSAHPHIPVRTVPGLAPMLAVILAVLLLAGCSGTLQGDAQEDASGAAAPQNDAPENARDAEDSGGDEDGAVTGSDVDVREREVVHTADLTVETPEVEETADSAKEWVDDAGGHVAAEDVTTRSGEGPRASLTLRVPTDQYEDALRELGDLGTQANLQREAEDVTEEVADVDSRVESAEATLDRLRDLVEDADTVEDVLAVESEIATRQQELEALQARQQALQDSTSFGTIKLSLLPPDTYLAEDESDSIGFTGGLARGWRALTAVAEGLSVAAGWLLPFLVVVAAAASPFVVWRRRRAAAKRGSAKQAGSAAEAAGEPAPEPVGARDGDSGSDPADDTPDEAEDGPPPEREA